MSHPSHVLRSSDSSFYEVMCVNCNRTDIAGGGWAKLAEPCPVVPICPNEAVARIERYIRDYEDAPSWGGPTIYPPPPSVDDLKELLKGLI